MEAEIYDSRSLKDIYFEWLWSKISQNGPYFTLANQLFSIEFTFILPLDRSRQSDGRDLRAIFEDENGLHQGSLDKEIITYCSVLEMLIGLAERIDQDVMYEADKGNRTADWFYRMINNLGLSACTDENYSPKMAEFVEKTVKKWLARDIEFNGNGGIFPLKSTKENQKNVLIWYQMQAYLMENFPI